MRMFRKVRRWCWFVRLNYRYISEGNPGATRWSCFRAAMRWATNDSRNHLWMTIGPNR